MEFNCSGEITVTYTNFACDSFQSVVITNSYFMILFDIIKTDLLRISRMEGENFKSDLNVPELHRIGEINVEICKLEEIS